MSATEELRAMLDERGVEWWNASPRKTKWNSPVLGGPVAVSEWNGKMVLDTGYVNVTPKQAIAATLGAGTCHEVEDEDTGFICCSECGAIHDESYTGYYCWCCGRKVVDE